MLSRDKEVAQRRVRARRDVPDRPIRSSVLPGAPMTSNPAFLFARGCQTIGSSTPAMLPADTGIEMLAGSPLFRGVSGHRWKSPSSASVDPTAGVERDRPLRPVSLRRHSRYAGSLPHRERMLTE
jgi:hypothetical protein